MFGSGKRERPSDAVDFFTVYDSKTGVYELPAPALNSEDMVRGLVNFLRKDREHKFMSNAEDYSLFRIGTFDKRSGSFIPVNLEHVANLNDLRSVALAADGRSGALLST